MPETILSMVVNVSVGGRLKAYAKHGHNGVIYNQGGAYIYIDNFMLKASMISTLKSHLSYFLHCEPSEKEVILAYNGQEIAIIVFEL